MPESVTTPQPGRFGPLALASALGVGLLAGGGLIFLTRGDATPPVAEASHEADLPPGMVQVPVEAQKNAKVEIVAVERRPIQTSLLLTGVVAPEESRVAHVRPLARGVIETISVSLGARVAKGQPLVTYDNIEMGQLVGEYLSAKAEQRQAEADMEVRRQALARAQELIKLEAVAQQTLELRIAEFRNAEAGVASRRAGVARIEEQLHRFGLSDPDLARLTPDEGRSAHRSASHAILRAPVAGVVTKYEVAAGELVEPDRELFTITDLSTVWVMADVYEKDLAKVRAGFDVEVRVDAYPDRVFQGRLTYVNDLIDPQTRTAKVRCVVNNSDGALKLEMFARVSVPTPDRRDALVIPISAVQQIDGKSVVFAQEGPSRFSRKFVTIGSPSGDWIEVLEGLSAGTRIVAGGSFYLKTALLRELIGDEH